MRTIVVLNSGDGTGLNFTRCLHKVGGWFVIGVDGSLADYHGGEADVRYLFEWTDHREFVTYVQEIVHKHSADLLYAADTSPELLAVSRHRDEFDAKTFLPEYQDHLRMEDKWATWQTLRAAGIPVPDTALATDRGIVAAMLAEHGTVWLRRVNGSAGAGSVATDSFDFAIAWLDREHGWGKFTVAQRLTSRTATLTALWSDGELVASQLRERLGWKYPSLAASGVTGITGAQRTIWDPKLHTLGLACVRAMASAPHGAIGVDFTYDDVGQALPTEVQPARFYSSMQFLAEAGVNFPNLYCDLALHGRRDTSVLLNPIRQDVYWVKNVDKVPELLSKDEYFAR